jgi:hypothetical protein
MEIDVEIRGVSGKQLLSFAGTIPSDDWQLMQEAIEQDCEQIDILQKILILIMILNPLTLSLVAITLFLLNMVY